MCFCHVECIPEIFKYSSIICIYIYILINIDMTEVEGPLDYNSKFPDCWWINEICIQ